MNKWLPLNLKLQKLRAKLLSDPYYRLQSGEEVQMAAELGLGIDANQATVDDWLRLPGLSIHQGRSLVELSRAGVVFYCIEDVAAALGLPVQRLEPLKPLLNFNYYDNNSLDQPPLVNPNTASVESLSKIPFIDSSLAQKVVENRLAAGPYRSLADFQRRLELPGDAIAQLMYYLRFS
ncbi:ComEA family DNA-binding protein [Anabaena sp. UHCC 0204]|uniref:helix-hairpin-helix domain-containing protein n=1 Tax=Anabaena sp. UHCC 0204 TaxID=2590009 RepID=UPI0014469501|nr:ComEA family DNA-binding protein [Anabaena sp. UHCC 0204]MTJ07209.1 ComEA family DNA-binding protein [Anabaena sp. UHCC 0204]